MSIIRSMLEVVRVLVLIVACILTTWSEAMATQTNADDSVASGCLDQGATMYAVLTDIGPPSDTEEVYILDTTGDGLPEYVYCSNGYSQNLLPILSSNGTNCTGLKVVNGCAFPFRVFMGTSGDNNNGSGGPIDCSGVGYPMMFFGGNGEDQFIGTSDGDFIAGGFGDDTLSGGPGPDFICASRADDGNVADGDAGNDVVWGGPDEDTCYGGDDDDLVHGAVESDFVYGEDGDDSVHGGDRDDECDGGEGEDWVHAGKGADEIYIDEDEPDTLYVNDDGSDTPIDADNDYDECSFDANDTLDCLVEHTVFPICDTEHPFVVATSEDGDYAELNELTYLGPRGVVSTVDQVGRIWIASEEAYAVRVVGMAVDPTDCNDLYAVLEFDDGGIVQYLASLDLATHPTNIGAPGIVYEATLLGSSIGSPSLVDIAFDDSGQLAGLDEDAGFVYIDKSTGSFTSSPAVVGPTGAWSTGTFSAPTGYRMAYDAPDGGLFLSLVQDPNPDELYSDDPMAALNAYSPQFDFSTSHEDHIVDPYRDIPFTVTNANHVGVLFTINPDDNTASCGTGEYRYQALERVDWELSLWDEWGCNGTTCCAELGTNKFIDAITIPHFVAGP